MENSVFIKFPWTKNPANEVYVTHDQIKAVYDIIIKAFTYKHRFEQGSEYGIADLEKYDLDNIKVYNSFVNENLSRVFYPKARAYVLETIKNIRSNSFKKKSVKESYSAIFSIFGPTEPMRKTLRTLLSNDPNHFIDFCTIFGACNKKSLTLDEGLLKEITSYYRQKLEEHKELTSKGLFNFK